MAQTFDQYLAESGQQNTLDELRRNFQYDKAKAQYESSGGYGSGSSGGVQSVQDIMNQMYEQQKKYTEPAIATIKAQEPKIQEVYGGIKNRLQAEVDPLKTRYNQLLAQVTGNQQEETQRVQGATNRELGLRGLTGESGLYNTTMNEALSPVTRYYTEQGQSVSSNQESALRALQNQIAGVGDQETQALINQANTIAQIQASMGQGAVQSALSIYGQQQQAAQNAASLAAQKSSEDWQRTIAEQSASQQAQLFPTQLAEAQLALKQRQTPVSTKNPADYFTGGYSQVDWKTGKEVKPSLNSFYTP